MENCGILKTVLKADISLEVAFVTQPKHVSHKMCPNQQEFFEWCKNRS